MNNQEKKVEIKTKPSAATQIATGIAILAIVAAGSGLIAHFALLPYSPSTAEVGPILGGGPTSFNLVSPANEATDQDDEVTLTWETSSPTYGAEKVISDSGDTIKLASLGHTSVKLAGSTVYYRVYLGTSTTDMTQVATGLSSTSYTATELVVNTTYYWKVQAYNSYGTKTSSTWSFSTAGIEWLLDQGYTVPPPGEGAACGANRECDADGVMSCAEWNSVWLACSGVTNKCPDNLEEQCLQMTICQCNDITPGGAACATYMNTFTDPCGY